MTRDAADSHWYLAQLKPGGLQRACENLARQSFETFMPQRRVTRRQAGRLVPGAEPLFPGYLFVRIAPGRADWRAVNSTYGVKSLVALSRNAPTQVPPEIMADLRGRADSAGFVTAPDDLGSGDQVRIVDGPLSALLAQIDEVPGPARVYALIDMMGRTVRAELGRGDIQQI